MSATEFIVVTLYRDAINEIYSGESTNGGKVEFVATMFNDMQCKIIIKIGHFVIFRN